MNVPYPDSAAARAAWVVSRRGPKAPVDARRPVGWFLEPERSAEGDVVPVLTVLLANRECPWKCVYCDLWRHTLDEPVRPGDVTEQVRVALRDSGVAEGRVPARQIKLYNAGSFFDPGAIPDSDASDVAALVRGFDRVIVESHPRLIGERTWRFRNALGQGTARLEVAMGLESADPGVVARLNKGMTLEDLRAGAVALLDQGVAWRAFVLVQPPFEGALARVPRAEADPGPCSPDDAFRGEVEAVEWALAAGATAISLIPTRPGNGALNELRRQGWWEPPTLDRLEDGYDRALRSAAGRGRVFVDLWDLERFSSCSACLPTRRDRLRRMNHSQQGEPRACCPHCYCSTRSGDG